jgi:hypothetical protein
MNRTRVELILCSYQLPYRVIYTSTMRTFHIMLLALAVCGTAVSAPASVAWLSQSSPDGAGPDRVVWEKQSLTFDIGKVHAAVDAAGAWLIDSGKSADDGEPLVFDVDRPAKGLVFVHTYQPGEGVEHWRRAAALAKRAGRLPPPAPAVLRYTVRYVDGVEIPVDVRWRESIQDWYRFVDQPMPLPWAEAVVTDRPERFRGEPVADWSFRPHQVIYRMTWPNPRPKQPIKSVSAASAERAFEEHGRALVFAVGTTDRAMPQRVRLIDPMAGDDTAAGTWDRPWRTPHHAFNRLEPGDLLLLRGGRYGITQTLVLRQSGTEDRPITIASVPGETAVLDAARRPVSLPGAPGPGPVHDDGALELHEVTHVNLVGLGVEHSGGNGIKLYHCRHVTVMFCRTFETFSSGISDSRGQHIRVIGNTVVRPNSKLAVTGRTDQRLSVTNTPHEGMTFGSTRHYDVGWNEIYFGDKEGIDSKGANRHGVKHHNYVHQTASVGIYIDCWREHIEDIEIYRNTLQQSGAITVGSEVQQSVWNIRVHHNLVYDSLKGVNLFDPKPGPSNPQLQGVRVRNNTLYRNGYQFDTRGWTGAGVLINGSRMSDIVVEDNLIADTIGTTLGVTQARLAERQIQIRNNVFWPAVTASPGEARWPETPGENSVFVEPDFVAAEQGLFFLNGDLASTGDYTERIPGAFVGQWAGDPGIDPNTQRVRLDYQGPLPQAVIPIPPAFRNVNFGTKGSDRDWFHGGGMYNQDLLALPSDRQHWTGIEWDLPAHDRNPGPHAVMLGGTGSVTRVQAVRGLPINRSAEQLHFLHTYNPARDIEAGDVVMRYVVHYDSGQKFDIPVIWRTHVGPWLSVTGTPLALEGAEVAWFNDYTRRRPSASLGDRQIAIYSMTWNNPHPQRAIRSVDFVSTNTTERDRGAGALVAITASGGQPTQTHLIMQKDQ